MLGFSPSYSQQLSDKLFEEKKVTVYVQREDAVHPIISGNKWRKLKYNCDVFKSSGKEYLVTFGGAYSNHILATAEAGKELSIKTIGIIRGKELNSSSNANLQLASKCGMKLFFVSREDYRKKNENEFIKDLLQKISEDLQAFYIVPEGGANELGVKGCAEINTDVSVDFDYILCACGTGTTLAGITSSLNTNQRAIGISVLQGKDFLDKDIQFWLKNAVHRNFLVLYDYSFGGYAKSTKTLNDFCINFYLQHGIFIEPIYTGKLFFALYDLIRKDYFKPGTRIIGVHTGPGRETPVLKIPD